MERIDNYINGQWVAADDYLVGEAPATGEHIYQLANADHVQLAQAVEAAQTAFPAWRDSSIAVRAECLRRLADLIDSDSEVLAALESQDTGKPLSLAQAMDIPRSAINLRYFASAVEQWSGTSHSMGTDALNYGLQQPIGVVACISPWNLPLYLFTWKIAPALAAGNCVIAKPSELTPLTAHHLTKLLTQAGFPAGVCQVLHGYGGSIGQALCEHPDIAAISFTGGTQTGATVAVTAAAQFKKCALELGGKNPSIVFADSDIDMAVDQIVRSSFANQGEICLCTSRILLERSIYAEFREKFVKKVQQLVVGDPMVANTQVGALISQAHQEKVLQYISLAKQAGGEILCGGEAVTIPGRCAKGYFVAPTVIDGLSSQSRCNQEEIFGPVTALLAFDDESQALAIANGTRYGLAASVWTQHLQRAHRMAAGLAHGVVWINCWLLRDLRTPFGGMKDSGMGREGGFGALHFFSEEKNVCIKL